MKFLNSAIFKILISVIASILLINVLANKEVDKYIYDNYIEKLKTDMIIKSNEVKNILSNMYKISFLKYAYDSRLYKDNELLIRDDSFMDIKKNFKNYLNYYVYIFDIDGKLVLNTSSSNFCKDEVQIFNNKTNTFRIGEKCSIIKDTFSPWYYNILLVHDNIDINSDLEQSANFMHFILIVLAVVLILVLSLILYFIFSRPINQIMNYLRSIKSGNYEEIKVSSSSEFSEVADGINSMIKAINKREQTLQIQFKNMKDNEKKLSLILNSQPSIIMMIKNHKVYNVNSKFFHIFNGFKNYDDFSKKYKSIVSLMVKKDGYLHAKDDKNLIDKVLVSGKSNTLIKYNEKFYIFEVTYSKIDFKGENFAILVFRDITSEVKQKEEISRQLWTDSLTSLPNRNSLLKSMEENSILYIVNIDRFKQINDFYGYNIGDFVLIELGKFLKGFLANLNSYTLYKLSADEFAIYRTKASELDFSQSEYFVKKMHEFIGSHHITVSNQKIKLSITVGIARTTNIDYIELLSSADMALKNAKETKKPYVMYSSVQHVKKEYQEHIKWSNILQDAYAKDNLFPVFQPIVCTKTQKIIKYEALIRLRHEGKVYSPFFFLDVASMTRMYSTITKIVFTKSFAFFKNNNVEVSINVSPDEIIDKEIYSFIMELLTLNPAVAKRVTIELVETEAIEDFDAVLKFINAVRKFGCKIAIDDFGTGYSNFSYMVKLKADYLKIDGSLIKDIAHDDEAFKLVSGITSLAKGMGMEVIAEFIADKEIYDRVASLNIEYCQGYYFGKPENIANF